MFLGTAKIFFMRLLNTGIAVAISILLARTLGVSAYGDYILVLTITTTVAIPIQFGLSGLLIRETARLSSESEVLGPFYSWAMWFTLKFSVIGCIVLAITLTYLHAPPMRNLSNLILIASAMFVAVNFLSILASILAGLKQTEKEQFLNNVLRPSTFLGLLLVAVWGFSPAYIDAHFVLAAQFISVFLVLAFLAIAVLKQIKIPLKLQGKRYAAANWYRSVLVFMMIGGIDILLQSVDILMLGAILSSDEVAIYRIGAVAAALLSMPLSAASTYATPQIAAALTIDDTIEMQRRCIFIAKISFGVTFTLLIVAVLLGRFVIEIAYGADYSGAYIVLIVLGFGSAANVMMGLNRAVLTMKGHEAAVFRVMGCSALINVVLNALAITHFGAVGAAVATSITVILWNVWLHFESYRALGYSVAIFSRQLTPYDLQVLRDGKGYRAVKPIEA